MYLEQLLGLLGLVSQCGCAKLGPNGSVLKLPMLFAERVREQFQSRHGTEWSPRFGGVSEV